MDPTMKQIPCPQVLLDFFHAVDSLDVAAFKSLMAPDLVGVFGEKVMHGPDEYAKGFLQVDSDFNTKHNVTAVFQIENCYVFQGSADLTPKSGGPTKHLAPLVNFFWLNKDNKIASHVVSFAPGEKPAGYKS